MSTKGHPRAILKALRYVLLPSWLAILLLWLLGLTGIGFSSGGVQTLAVLWVIFGLGVDAVVLELARSRLRSDFRELAAHGRSRRAAAAASPSP